MDADILDALQYQTFNRSMAEKLSVNLEQRSYDIHFATNAAELIREAVAGLRGKERPVVVVTDATLQRVQAKSLGHAFAGLPLLAVEPGEPSKSLGGLGRVLDFLATEKVDRTGVVFAVGGGVIGDLAGFAAASWLRGVDYYQVPTTLLAMVDSSVGGKTGINIDAGKNLVGAFHQPRGVFISVDHLATLPAREFAAGMAEVIKYGLLGDAELFSDLEARPLTIGDSRLASIIRRCCALKARVVEADERETAKDGGRALLNLGHTFGHAIENAAGYGAYLHGEAVAIGLCAAARLSQKLGYVSVREVARVEQVLSAHALPTSLRTPLSLADLQAAMSRDKKVRAGGLRFVVLKQIGVAMTQGEISPDFIQASFREVGAM